MHSLVERALKKAILHRRNSLFYKTRKGARMGDLFMSLIHTCELNCANSFDYLIEVQRHPAGLKGNPSELMPWNYRRTLTRFATEAAQKEDPVLAEKDRFRPASATLRKCPPNGRLRSRNRRRF